MANQWQTSGLRNAFISQTDVFNAEDRARQTLATIIGGALVFVGAYFTWRNTRAAEKNAEVAVKNAEVAVRNTQISEAKLITDRFTAAVNNLSADGPDKMAQRLGGIYALERIARDSADDHWTVMEVLTAYLRDKRPKTEITNKDAEKEKEDQASGSQVFPTDIQATLTVIGRRAVEQDKGCLDLHRTDLSLADLSGADLSGAKLEQADLRRAKLGGADLRQADLRRTDLWGADLRGADLRGADLWSADLPGADLRGADLSGAMLKLVNLSDAVLCEADLSEADLSRADLSRADLTNIYHLTQKQLNTVKPDCSPESLPNGLHVPVASQENTPPAPDAGPPPTA